VQLNGGGAVWYSPPIPVHPQFAYSLGASIKTQGLNFDRAYFSVDFLRSATPASGKLLSEENRVGEQDSEPQKNLKSWTDLQLGPVLPPEEARFAVIGLHLEPTDREDVFGEAMFDDVWVRRLPRLAFAPTEPFNFYLRGKPIKLQAKVSGITLVNPVIRYEVQDVFGNLIQKGETTITGNAVALPDYIPPNGSVVASQPTQIFAGESNWSLDSLAPGFYSITVRLSANNDLEMVRSANLVVITPVTLPKSGEFGWTLPGPEPIDLEHLPRILKQSGVSWVKYPVWREGQSANHLTDISWFAERLATGNIRVVGILDNPPTEVREHLPQPKNVSAADIFVADTDLWYPSLDPIFSRLAISIRTWQLGGDDDASFVGMSNISETVAKMRRPLERFGRSVRVGIGWRWINELPNARIPSYQYMSFSSEPPLTADELETYLPPTQGHGIERWVVLHPLDVHHYDLYSRVIDMTRRMLTAKRLKAEAIVHPSPFDPDTGLLSPDGTPAELYLPWRSISSALAGTTYLGRLELPGGSHNEVFGRDGNAVVVLWNEQGVTEHLFLGSEAKVTDIWGRSVALQDEKRRQTLEVGPWPLIITNASEPLLAWQLALRLREQRIPSVFGKRQQNSLEIGNPFLVGIAGRVKMKFPRGWDIIPDEIDFQLPMHDQQAIPIEIQLPLNATSGKHEIDIDVELSADHVYQFELHRQIYVGKGGVYIDVSTRLTPDDNLIVKQRFVNKTDGLVDFDCYLYAPQRRRMRSSIRQLPRGVDVRTYVLPQGSDLIGKQLWLRAEEQKGDRVLNYRVTHQP